MSIAVRVRAVSAALFFVSIAAAARTPPPAPPPPHPPNILLIVLDTVRFDATSFGNPAQNNTPFLASLAARSTVFTHAYTTHDFTPTAHFSMFTGLDDGLGTSVDRPERGLAWQLRQNGYEAFAVVGNSLLDPKQMPVMRGFERVEAPPAPGTAAFAGIEEVTQSDMRLARFQIRPTNTARAHLHFCAERLLGDVVKEAKAAKQPFFGFVNLVDAHEPYVPDPDTYRPEARVPPGFNGDVTNRRVSPALLHPDMIADPAKRADVTARLAKVHFPYLLSDDLSAEELAIYHARYLATVRDLDAQLKTFFEAMMREHLLDETVVVITSDHGESFGEDGYVTHMLENSGDPEATRHVPLLIVLPPMFHRNATTVDRVVGLDMLAPTLYALAGVDDAPLREDEGYAPSLVSFVTTPPQRVGRVHPYDASQAPDLTESERERQQALRSLGYVH